MRKVILILTVLLMAWGATPAFSLPTLQLDISDGVYVGGTEESVFATGNQFTLSALLNDPKNELLGNTYYISAAVVTTDPTGPVDETASDLGTISINGQTINVTSDMVYGTPPLDVALENKDLGSHGVYPTYYVEKTFTFDAANTVPAYNIDGSEPNAPGTLYASTFDIDISGLAEGYGIHFDLYDVAAKKGDLVLGNFAPFSHDAQANATTGDTPDPNATPEPATMFLLGSGLVGLVGLKRRKKLVK